MPPVPDFDPFEPTHVEDVLPPEAPPLYEDDRQLVQTALQMQKGLESIEGFMDWMRPSGHADCVHAPAEHHRLIINHLEKVEAGEIENLIILAPWGSAKSTYVSVLATCWWWARHPHHHLLKCSATQNLSERFARRCRALCMEDRYHQISDFVLDPNHMSLANFGNDKGGSITSAGVGSSIIGLRSNFNVLDDPVSSFEDVATENSREKQFEWFRSEFSSRKVPGAPTVIAATRWHSDDIVGRLLKTEPEKWTVLRLPMISEGEDTDPLNRPEGQILWPEWYRDEDIIAAKKDPLRWACSFQQTPLTSEGDWLAPENIPVVDEIPRGVRYYAALDLALSQGKGDWTVVLIAAYDQNGCLTIVDMFRDRVSPDRTVEHLVRLKERWNFTTCLTENSPAEKTFLDLFHRAALREGHQLHIYPLQTRGQNKEVRASAIQGIARMGGLQMLRAPWNADVYREVVAFPNDASVPDDIVDALGMLGRFAKKMSPGQHPALRASDINVKAGLEHSDNGGWQTTQTLDDLFKEREEAMRQQPRIRRLQ